MDMISHMALSGLLPHCFLHAFAEKMNESYTDVKLFAGVINLSSTKPAA